MGSVDINFFFFFFLLVLHFKLLLTCEQLYYCKVYRKQSLRNFFFCFKKVLFQWKALQASWSSGYEVLSKLLSF